MNVILIYCNERKGKDEGNLWLAVWGVLWLREKVLYWFIDNALAHITNPSLAHSLILLLLFVILVPISEIYRAYFFCFIFAEFSNRFTHYSSQGTLILSECCSHLNALTASPGNFCHNIEYPQHRLNIRGIYAHNKRWMECYQTYIW